LTVIVPARRINAVSAPERQPPRVRRCVDQTIAAEALEGWRPTGDQVDALTALVEGAVPSTITWQRIDRPI
jgi:hypothetical protein